MSTISLADLLVEQTEAQFGTTILGSLAAAGFPTTSWASTSVPVGLINAFARASADTGKLVPKIAAGGLVAKATGGYLTLLASSNYLEERTGATRAVRNIRLTDLSGAPTVIAVGDLLIQSAAGRYYRNSTGGTLAASSTLDLQFTAEETGTASNADTAPWSFSTALPGVTLTHLALLTAAVDEQSDQSLRDACTSKWSTLGAGANDEAYKYWATHTPSVTEVVRVKVRRHHPLPGQVTLVLAGASTTVSGGTVTAVQNYIDPVTHLGKAPTCVDVIVGAAVEVPLVPAATVYRRASYAAAITAEHAVTIPAIAKDTEIGGTAYLAEFFERLMDPEGVVNVTITVPAADVVLGANEILTITDLTSITYVDV